jgi:sarcosine oxidase, subunit gamma
MDERAHVLVTEVADAPSVQITPVRDRTILRLRSWFPRAMQDGPIALAGLELPSQVGAMFSGATHVLCLGPQDWLIVSKETDPSSIRTHLQPGLALIDLTDGLATFEVQGRGTRELLSKGCGLDLHPQKFSTGRCARTRFAQIPLTMACARSPDQFELFIGRSYASYFMAWLTDAATTVTKAQGY